MAPRLKINGMERTTATRKFVDEFIATEQEAGTIRTIWYQIKHQVQPWQNGQSEKNFSDAINIIIGDHLWNRYIGGELDLYERLNIKSKALVQGGMPVVLFCEKQLPDFDAVAKELDGCIYLSSGQVPSFEIAQVAKHLSTLNEPTAYLFGMVDYDPSGISVYGSLSRKLTQALDAESGGRTELRPNLITFDDVDAYETYRLSVDQAKKWSNGDHGVELDVVPAKVRKSAVKDAVYEAVEPGDYKRLSLQRARKSAYLEALKSSEKYQTQLARVYEIESEINAYILTLDHTFYPDKWNLATPGMVQDMTKLEVA